MQGHWPPALAAPAAARRPDSYGCRDQPGSQLQESDGSSGSAPHGPTSRSCPASRAKRHSTGELSATTRQDLLLTDGKDTRQIGAQVTNVDKTLDSDLSSAEAQQALLILIFNFFIRERKSPTYRELAAKRGRTPSTIYRAVKELRHKGYIDKDPESSRAGPRDITLTDRAVSWLKSGGYDVTEYLQTAMIKAHVTAVPVLGEIAAGNPILAEENAESYLTLPSEYLPIGKVFILDVVGDSMTGDGVLDGDQVLVVPYPDPKGKGEMVTAIIDDAATVKRLWRDGDGYSLVPSNPDFEAIPIGPADIVLIQGRVVGLLRWNIK